MKKNLNEKSHAQRVAEVTLNANLRMQLHFSPFRVTPPETLLRIAVTYD